ncbi:hypothetical protein Ocin01_03237 [Orchesella cincta]|uniref:WAP domain-containing protein n=1 Tax=Orchesella cincta TaxID=48709 RepID=A0A1D2NDY7_ORCCI|nr:hypothetical protein Ocin01_03237 [Orchesella cincta]
MFVIVLFLTALALGAFADEATESSGNETSANFCGQDQPDSEKTCISLRLPWQEEPIYFCTDKAKIKYKDRCGHDINRYCYNQERENSLQIATPWDCCPLTSVPDFCFGRNCPAAPFNRTCDEIQPDRKNPWDCCSTFYCDKNVKPEECHMKRLTPGCMKAPKNKTNCVGFKDKHGCCNKYQCDGDAKVGMCPMEAQALKFKQLMEDEKSADKNLTSLTKLNMPSHSHRRHWLRGSGSSTTFMQCAGDYTCPGSMKCCSMDIESYHGVRKYLQRSTLGSTERAVYGYCMEPVEMG